MKKIYERIIAIAAVITGVCFFSVCNGLAANNAIEEMIGYQIMEGDENGEFQPERPVTRAEFCAIIMRCHGYDDGLGAGYENPFYDVREDHWAYGSISALCGMGIINGVDDHVFEPEGTVTDEQAAKILLLSLGYGIEAQNKGGYPAGYMAVAAEKGLLRGIYIDNDNTMTREEIAVLIYNALDTPMIVQNISKSGSFYTDNGMTIRKLHADMKDRLKAKGIVTGTGVAFAGGEDNKYGLYIEIDGQLCYTEGRDWSEYMGMEVNYYYDFGEDDAKPRIYTMFPTKNNKVVMIDSPDIVSADLKNGKLRYDETSSRTKNAAISSDAVFVYNGKIEYALDDDDVTMNYGNLRLVDNDTDGKYDYIFVNSYEIFVADRLSASKNLFLLKNERDNGAKSFVINSDDDSYVYSLAKNGEVCTFEDINENDIISVMISLDKKYTVMNINEPKMVEGSLTLISQENQELGIDGELYEYVNANSMKDASELVLGDNYLFYINDEGKVVYFSDEHSGKTSYCYVIKAYADEWDDQCTIKIIHDNKVSKYICASNLKIDGARYEARTAVNVLNAGDVYKMSLNSDGEVKDLESVKATAVRSDRRYNKKYSSFRDMFAPFRTDDGTVIYMIPTGSNLTDEDYLTAPDLKDNSLLECAAYAVDEETQVADVVVVYGAFAYEDAGTIVKSSTASIVDDIKYIYNNETKSTEAVVSLYQYGSYLNVPVRDDDRIMEDVGKLKTGDVIFYSVNTLGKMDNIQIIATDIWDMDIQKTGFTDDKGKMKGYVSRCKKNWMKQNSNIISNVLYLSLDAKGVNEEAFVLETEVENQIDSPIYCIDRSLKTVYPINVDDILSIEDTGAEADVAFVYSINSAAQVVVVIKK